MTKFAMIYRGHYFPLTRSGTIEDAKTAALEELLRLCCEGDDRFSIIEITDVQHFNVRQFDDWFAQKLNK